MLLAYHYIQLADHTVHLNDPVDGLGALEQQDDVTMQQGIVLQGPQFHYNVHLESTTEKKRKGGVWLISSALFIMLSASGQLIKNMDTFPEKQQSR